MWHSLWFIMSFYIQSTFLKRGPGKSFPNPLIFSKLLQFLIRRKTNVLFKLEQKPFECWGELMSLNESSESCDQRTYSPCSVNYSSVQWSTCSWLLGKLDVALSWFNVANTGRSGLNRSSSLVVEDFGLEPRGAENTSFIFSQPIKMQRIAGVNMSFDGLEIVLDPFRAIHFGLDVFAGLFG